MKEIKEINIEWSGLVSPCDVDSTERGLYQFYGYHNVYGKNNNVLLYIGMTVGLKGRASTHEYLNMEGVPEIFSPELIKIRQGHVSSDDGVKLKVIEGLLIFAHTPAWNSKSIRNYDDEYRDIIIKNNGERGDLLEEVIGKNFGMQQKLTNKG